MDLAAYEAMRALQQGHWWWRGMRQLYHAALRYGLGEARPRRIIDVGCGFGANLPVLAQWRAPDGLLVGVDAEFEALEAIPHQAGVVLVQASADALPFKAAAFDLIGLLAVVEHVEDDARVLRESQRIAAPNAVQLLLTSALMLLWSHHDIANQHKRRYTVRQVHELHQRAGWRVLRGSYVNASVFPAVLTVRWWQRRGRAPTQAQYDMGPNPPVLRVLLEYALGLEAWLVLRGIPLPFGVDVFMISRKD